MYRARWFVRVAGVEPTNNAAERPQRPAVLWRRRSFGCHRDRGCRFVERVLTVVHTLRMHERRVIDCLADAITAHRQGLPPPNLLPASWTVIANTPAQLPMGESPVASRIG
jgi:transposase